jgi:hypothetical protein
LKQQSSPIQRRTFLKLGGSGPAWDTKIMARRLDGQLWLSRNWTGEDPPLDAGRVAFYALARMHREELRAPLPRNLGGCEHCGHRRLRGKRPSLLPAAPPAASFASACLPVNQ